MTSRQTPCRHAGTRPPGSRTHDRDAVSYPENPVHAEERRQRAGPVLHRRHSLVPSRERGRERGVHPAAVLSARRGTVRGQHQLRQRALVRRAHHRQPRVHTEFRGLQSQLHRTGQLRAPPTLPACVHGLRHGATTIHRVRPAARRRRPATRPYRRRVGRQPRVRPSERSASLHNYASAPAPKSRASAADGILPQAEVSRKVNAERGCQTTRNFGLKPPFCAAVGSMPVTTRAVQIRAFGSPSGQHGGPGGDVGDQLQGARDGGEPGPGLRPGGVLVVQLCHPAADAPTAAGGRCATAGPLVRRR